VRAGEKLKGRRLKWVEPRRAAANPAADHPAAGESGNIRNKEVEISNQEQKNPLKFIGSFKTWVQEVHLRLLVLK
jgi:hypothetical protein